MKRKTHLRRFAVALLAALMLLTAIPFVSLPASAATTVGSVTVSGNGTVDGIAWTPGFIGSFSNRAGNAWKFVARTYAKSFRTSDVIIVPEAGTTIHFSEYCNGENSLTNNVFVVSSWKQEGGEWVIDPSGVELVANLPVVNVKPKNRTLGVQYYEPDTNTMYYTYTTTKPNEALRFTIFGAKEGGGYLAAGEGPTVTAYKATFTEGTVGGIQWYPGYVGSASNSSFNHVNTVANFAFEGGTRYHISMPITVPKAGTTITFTDPTPVNTLGSGLYQISTWTRGKDGQLDFLFGIPGSWSASCTYTTTYDNEIIRLCLNTWNGSQNTVPDAVVTYKTGSGEVGTLTKAGYQPNNIGLVQKAFWTAGAINSTGIQTNSAYAYSSIIPIFGKNIQVSFTDWNTDNAGDDVYVFALYTDIGGETLDTTATHIAGNNSNYYTDANGARTYTYTTTRDVTYLRLCYRSGEGEKIMPIVYRTEPNAVVYDEDLEGLNVLVLGDSLMDLRSLWIDSTNAESTGSTGSYNDINQQFIMQSAAKYGWHVINYGISGSPISDNASTGMVKRWEDMQDISPDIIIFEGGGNDRHYDTQLGTFDSYDTSTLCGAINTVLDGMLAKFPNALIICSTAWLRPDSPHNTSNGVATRHEYVSTLTNLVTARNCSRVKVVAGYDLDNFPVYADDETFLKLYGMDDTDGSHFNAEGQTILSIYYESHISRLYQEYLSNKSSANEGSIVFQNAEGSVITAVNTSAQGGSVVVPKPQTVQTVGKQLVGWKRLANGQESFVSLGDTLTYAAGESAVYTPVYMGLTAETTPSIRFTPGSTGMRFTAHIPLADWTAVTALATATERGTLIVPEFYVELIGGELTHAALDAAGAQRLDVKAGDWYTSDEETGTFAGSIANIKAKNHTLNFSAAGYVKITYTNGDSAYFYATDAATATRTVYALAYEAMHDRSTTQTDEYVFEVSAGSYSPYNQAQIEILEGFLSPVIALVGSTSTSGPTLKSSAIYTQSALTLTTLLEEESSGDTRWTLYTAVLGDALENACGILVITKSGGFGSANAVYDVLMDEAITPWTYHAATDAVLVVFSTYSDFH